MSDKLMWKYELDPGADIRIPAGKNSRFMSAAMQFTPVMWVEHEATLSAEGKPVPVLDCVWEVLLAGTGVLVPAGWSYLDTVQLTAVAEMQMPDTGEIQQVPRFVVWHVYYRVADEESQYPTGSMVDDAPQEKTGE